MSLFKSQSIKQLAEALVKFQAEVENVSKDGKNPFFKSKYATLENVISTAKPSLTKNGLSFMQLPEGEGMTTIIMHTSGEFIEAWAALELKDKTPQGQGSAITYMRRYALSAALGLATEEDDDGNAASKPVTASKSAIEKPKVIEQIDKDKAKKAEIQKLCDDKVSTIGAPLLTKDDYTKYVLENTGLKLGEDSLDEIIKRLKALQL
jgi:hypothetical protein